MDTLTKKVFFAEPTIAELKKRKVVLGDPTDDILTTALRMRSLNLVTESYCMQASFFKETQRDPKNQIPSRWWRKKLPWIDIGGMPQSRIRQRLRERFKEPFSKGYSEDFRYFGYGWRQGNEVVIIPFTAAVEAAKMFKYEISNLPARWYDEGLPFGVKVYKENPLAHKHGAHTETTVSRTEEGASRAEVVFYGNPVSEESPLENISPQGHCCEYRKYQGIVYNENGEEVLERRNVLCKHHGDGEHKIAAYEHERGNDWTSKRNPVIYPAQPIADLWRAFELSWVRHRIGRRTIERELYLHEREALIIAATKEMGFDKAWYSRMKLVNLNWHTAE